MSDTVSVLGGTGAHGRALALRLARGGHHVVLGSRDAFRAQATAEKLRLLLPQARIDGPSNPELAAAVPGARAWRSGYFARPGCARLSPPS